MTIKKPMKAPETAETVATIAPTASATGGATIADRFKLDLQDPTAAKPSAGAWTVAALIAAVLALVAAGVLTFVLYQHWEFLQGV